MSPSTCFVRFRELAHPAIVARLLGRGLARLGAPLLESVSHRAYSSPMASVAQKLLTLFEDVARLDPDADAGELVAGRWVPVTRDPWRHGADRRERLRRTARLRPRAPRLARGHLQPWNQACTSIRTRSAVPTSPSSGPSASRPARAPQVGSTVRGTSRWRSWATSRLRRSSRRRRWSTWLRARVRCGSSTPTRRACWCTPPPDHVAVRSRDESLDGGDALPGFACTVAGIFA